MSHDVTYRHLNLELRWPLFEREGLEIGDDGALRLTRLPRLEDVSDPLPPVPGLEGPAGVGADECGNVYVADPASHRILRLDACADRAEPLRCLRGPGTGPGLLHAPRGLVVGPRDALYVADSRNGRVVVVDLETEQVRGYWDGRGPHGGGAPFVEPWDLAADRRGCIYVADPGAASGPGQPRTGGSLRRFDASGRPDGGFQATLAGQDVRPQAPGSVAVGVLAGGPEERLIVLDTHPPRVLAYHLDGRYDADATARWNRVVGAAPQAGSIAVEDGVLYATDPGGRVLAFDGAGAFLGAVAEPAGGIAGVGVDCHGRLVVHPGGGGPIRRAFGQPVHAACGSFLAGPFEAPSDPTRWQRLIVDADLPEGAHLRLFTLTSDRHDGSFGNRPTHPAPCGGLGVGAAPAHDPEPAPLEAWRAAPADATALLALNQPGEFLWIAGSFQGDGTATPTLRQIRLHHDEEGWLRYLPALYRRASVEHPFLERALSLFETCLDREEARIDALPRLFDARAAPDSARAAADAGWPRTPGGSPAAPEGSWLDWLAGWVDAPLDERWPSATRRRVVAAAFEAHGRRGTRPALRRLIRLHAGARAEIEEAQPDPPAWSLGEVSTLGFETRLAAEAAEGAVLDTTAVVDRSHLAEPGEFGPPMFAETAHRFHVGVTFAGDERAGLERVRRVVDREKPAHTTYTLCAVRARMRVGFQARVGIDAIVGGPEAPAARLDGATELGRDTTLAAPPRPATAPPAPRPGHGPRVGATTTLV